MNIDFSLCLALISILFERYSWKIQMIIHLSYCGAFSVFFGVFGVFGTSVFGACPFYFLLRKPKENWLVLFCIVLSYTWLYLIAQLFRYSATVRRLQNQQNVQLEMVGTAEESIKMYRASSNNLLNRVCRDLSFQACILYNSFNNVLHGCEHGLLVEEEWDECNGFCS